MFGLSKKYKGFEFFQSPLLCQRKRLRFFFRKVTKEAKQAKTYSRSNSFAVFAFFTPWREERSRNFHYI